MKKIICFLLAAAGTVLTVGAVEVKLTIQDHVNAARNNEPVATGVCFKPGEVKDLAKLALYGPDGKAVPAQFSPLIQLEDGSWQWTLLDFKGSLPANGAAEYVVKEGANPAPAKPVVYKEADNIFTLQNGLVEVVIDAATPVFELFSSVKVDGKQVLKGAGRSAMTCRDALNGNKLYVAAKPAKVAWDYRGSMRTTLMLEGDYVDEAGVAWLGYRVRVTCFADSKMVRVEHCLRNSCPTEERLVKVKDAYIRLGLSNKTANMNADGKDFLVNGELFIKHRLLSGYFSQGLHELSVHDGNLVLGVVPTYEGGFEPKLHLGYNNRDKDKNGNPADYNPDDTGSWWMADCTYLIDEFWLNFGGGDANLAKGLDSRLYALASARYYSDCEALSFGPFGTLEDEVNTYKAWGWKNIEARQAELLKERWMKALPDYHKASDLSHEETETDDAEGCLLMALRTGGRGYFDAGLAWARYYANNFVWREDFPFETKRAKAKKINLVGRDASEIVAWGNSYNNGRTCGCHFYGSGAMDYYRLTGEKELLMGALDIAKYARRKWDKGVPGKDRVGSWGTRGFGRQFMALISYYEITRDPEWKQVMDHAAELCLKDPDMKREEDWIAIHSPSSNGAEKKYCTKAIQTHERLRKYMEEKGLKWDEASSTVTDANGKSWEVYDMAGSWEQTYVQQGMERYWRLTGNKEAAEYVVGFANFFNKFSWDSHCQFIGYRLWGVHFPEKGLCLGSQLNRWDPKHDTCPGAGAIHSGWYTRFGPDVAARAFKISKNPKYLEQARMYWDRGSKRAYQKPDQSAPPDEVGNFASHTPPKDDSMLSTGLMFLLVSRQ